MNRYSKLKGEKKFKIFISSVIVDYNVLSISALQQCDPVICMSFIYIYTHTHSFSHIILHHVPSQVTRSSSLCSIAGSHCLSTPNAIVCIYSPQTPSPSHSLPLPLGNHKSVLHVHDFFFCGKAHCAIY